MSARPNKFTPAPNAPPESALELPAWVLPLVADTSAQTVFVSGLAVEARHSGNVSLVSVRVANAAGLASVEFEKATADAYAAIADQLSRSRASHPVRFWNFIPGIHESSEGSSAPAATAGQDARAPGKPAESSALHTLDRYMVFNAGRFAACKQWLGGEDAFPRLLATASGVGHGGQDLIIHALATAEPGVAIENPRQVPAYKYSQRYGPHPPCFARATVVTLGDKRRVLVGGTASVRGEESVFVGDLRKQLGETLDNLAALLQSATADDTAGPHLMTDVRVYHVRDEDVAALRPMTALAFPAAQVEFVRTDICRQDLLVEIEGVA